MVSSKRSAKPRPLGEEGFGGPNEHPGRGGPHADPIDDRIGVVPRHVNVITDAQECEPRSGDEIRHPRRALSEPSPGLVVARQILDPIASRSRSRSAAVAAAAPRPWRDVLEATWAWALHPQLRFPAGIALRQARPRSSRRVLWGRIQMPQWASTSGVDPEEDVRSDGHTEPASEVNSNQLRVRGGSPQGLNVLDGVEPRTRREAFSGHVPGHTSLIDVALEPHHPLHDRLAGLGPPRPVRAHGRRSPRQSFFDLPSTFTVVSWSTSSSHPLAYGHGALLLRWPRPRRTLTIG